LGVVLREGEMREGKHWKEIRLREAGWEGNRLRGQLTKKEVEGNKVEGNTLEGSTVEVNRVEGSRTELQTNR
jgi:hypothetical protein